MAIIFKLLRVNHWTKNLLIFAALVFSKSYTNKNDIIAVLVAYLSFCLLASSIYIINDLVDYKSDIKHPIKKKRPIASGQVSVHSAALISFLLMLAASAVILLVNPVLLWPFGVYYLLNIAYSFKLKHVVIVDVFTIAIGFVLRIVIGAIAINVDLSHWIIICTFLLAIFLAFGKRRPN